MSDEENFNRAEALNVQLHLLKIQIDELFLRLANLDRHARFDAVGVPHPSYIRQREVLRAEIARLLRQRQPLRTEYLELIAQHYRNKQQ